MTDTPLLMGRSGSLFGILSGPNAARETGVVILSAGLLTRLGPFRLHVNLARLLASLGFASIRLDQSGRGESPTRTGLSYSDALLADFDDANEALARLGIKQVVLVGLCSGADDAVQIASARSAVVGVVMLDGYAPAGIRHTIEHYRRGLMRPAAWVRFVKRKMGYHPVEGPHAPAINIRNWRSEPEMLGLIGQILARQARMLAIFTGGVNTYYNHLGQLSRRLPSFARAGTLREVYLPQTGHIYSVVHHREQVMRLVCQWCEESFPPPPAEAAKGARPSSVRVAGLE